ncbi:sodium:proton antiporter [Cellulomonas sp. PhB143]|uniref:cation:proton antiporter n=1 Tax=Cellulomonas sp. PhB143 TaxID=2485186 RepID=UPI000F47240E|nr:cation:proton antiporter [Cellulomonas sp. PhB143]ROS75613.1 NhaP-type Na+/H+ or K+/H+ antiporter [Cellulomonas sp. PhB143]
MDAATAIALVVALGVLSQIVAGRVRVPSILVLLVVGLVAGPVTGFLDPDAVFGDSLFSVVSLGVGLLLFEESLKLDFQRLRGGARRPVLLLVTVGATLTGAGASLICYLVLDLSFQRAAVVGAILIVSGPTVVGPLLALIRPKEPLGSVLAFEGIFIDPIGATVALAVANFALHEESPRLLATAVNGIWVGVVAALVYVVAVRWGRIPPGTEVILAIALAMLTYSAAEYVHDEAGLFATVAMGITLANQKAVDIEPLHEFGGHLGMLLVGSLFILLSARVDIDALREYALASLAVTALLVLVLRPAVAGLSTYGTVLTGRERAMVGWMAPRGIVAASTASVFALEFEDAGDPFPELVPVVFGVVLLTAVVYGLTGPLAARLLRVRATEPEALDADGVPVSVPGESTARRALG